MHIDYYIGRFAHEERLFSNEIDYIPQRKDLVFYDNEVYEVIQVMHDYDNNVCNVFMKVWEED